MIVCSAIVVSCGNIFQFVQVMNYIIVHVAIFQTCIKISSLHNTLQRIMADL